MSATHRQWIGISVGNQVTVEPLPAPPHPAAPSYLQSLDIEVGFLRRGHEIAEQFSADDMTRVFVKNFNGHVISNDEVMVFEFHGQNLKALIKGVSILELADEQRRGQRHPDEHSLGIDPHSMGILMDKTDVTFMKAGDSLIKIKSSAKK